MNGKEFMKRLMDEMKKAVVGREDVIELLAVALLSEGHILLEGIPGVAKTTIAKAFADAIGLEFKRIQMTPDILPADIIGCYIFDQKSGEFKLRKGPILQANVILADEINRATPKTQSALLEAMQEKQVTIEGNRFDVLDPFLVIATQNPFEQEGIYDLPEAQLDRFMIKIKLDYPERDEEITLLKRKERGDFGEVKRFVSKDELKEIMARAKRVKAGEKIIRYIHDIATRIRSDDSILLGVSPRALEHLLFASKSLAFLKGRDYVIPDDVKRLAIPVLSHRIEFKAEYETKYETKDDFRRDLKVEFLEKVLEEVEIPK